MPSFCWKCGKPLVRGKSGKAISVIRDYRGFQVTLHKNCAISFDKEEANDKWDWGKGPNSFKAFDD